MANSLNTAVSGLLAHQRKLDLVANNLANINTAAFKSQRILFSDLIYESLSPATGGNGVTIGGTNPIQVGTGVRTAQISRNFAQGAFNATGQPLDFAIQGDGFFVIADGNQNFYSRAGAFSLDESGYLIDPQTGYTVQRIGSVGEPGVTDPAFQIPGDDRIQVPLGTTLLGEPTENVLFNGILDATAVGPLSQVLTSANPFESSNAPAAGATLLNDLDTNLVDYSAPDVIDISGINSDGSPFSTALSVDGTTTLDDVLAAINGTLVGGLATLDADGNLVVTADDVGDSLINVSFADGVGNAGDTDFQNHSLVATTPGKFGDVFNGVMEIFDVRGGSHALSYEFQKMGVNTWDLTFDLPSGDGTVVDGTIQGIEFSDNGVLVGVNGLTNSLSSVTVNFDGILKEQTFDVSLDDMVQISTAFSMKIEQDGLEPSKLSSVRVNSDGTVQGISSNGQSIDLAQLAIALFRNPQGLLAVGNSYFTESLNSGDVEYGSASSGGRGSIRGGQLEGSNVDVAFEFTQLIVAQRGFSANARTITVADEVLEELTNIIR